MEYTRVYKETERARNLVEGWVQATETDPSPIAGYVWGTVMSYERDFPRTEPEGVEGIRQ